MTPGELDKDIAQLTARRDHFQQQESLLKDALQQARDKVAFYTGQVTFANEIRARLAAQPAMNGAVAHEAPAMR